MITKPMMLTIAALTWCAPQAFGAETDATQHGKELFTYWCATCHSAGEAYPGTVALQARYKGAVPAVLEERKDLSPALVKTMVRHGISVMPFFRKTEISDQELDAIAAYLSKPKR